MDGRHHQRTVVGISMTYPLLEWIRLSTLGVFVRESSWALLVLQSLHFFGMTLLIGVVGAIDLRILGLAPELPLRALQRFAPLAVAGFAINLVTGLLFFSHDPYAYAFNPSFRWKLLLIVLAGLNALWLRFAADSRLTKTIALASVMLWMGVIVAGRYIAFTAAQVR
jgi:hypothetical protein